MTKVIFFILLTGITFSGAKAQDILLTIDGEPVVEDEFVFFMKQHRALTYSYFYAEYNAEQESGFWTRSYSGEIPLQYIRNTTIRQLTSVKVHLMFARDMGLLDDIGWGGFLSGLEQENLRRKEKTAKGEAIYGPEQFTRETWFSYWYSNLVIDLKNTWKQECSVAPDSVGKKFDKMMDEKIDKAVVRIQNSDMNGIMLKHLR